MTDFPSHQDPSKYREEYRKQDIGKQYSGIRHLLITTSIVALVLIYGILNLRNLHVNELIIVPITIILGNLTVYLIHRFPMHRKLNAIYFIFRNHTLIHHYLFDENSMEYESTKDFKMILLSPLLISIVLSLLILPSHFLFRYLFTDNVGFLLLMAGTLYMGIYEWMHLSFHTPKDHWVNGIPGISWMRRHHTIHHRKAIMSKVNFNIVFPLSDFIFKSLRRSL